jgi:hypothetical protein
MKLDFAGFLSPLRFSAFSSDETLVSSEVSDGEIEPPPTVYNLEDQICAI